MNKINHYWRVIATGIAFSSFGLGALVLSMLFFPCCYILPQKKRIKMIQKSIHYAFKLFIFEMKILGIMDVKYNGLEKLSGVKGCMIVSNHPTLLDIVLLLSVIEGTDCIVKDELWQNPFLRGAVSGAGYIPNKSPEDLIHLCVDRLKEGHNIVVFPEGTRSLPDDLKPFKKGFSAITLKSNCQLLPIFIKCEPSTLTKREKWYNVPNKKFILSMEVNEFLDVPKITKDCKSEIIASKVLKNYLFECFKEKRASYE
ncbi:MAG: 1-acyl-sn-glycerol-3-phosphate acyltransferase [Planctomycetota bacterium]|nr:MAG: 1-acyl-sn-glycerol-3-phosphate acyltransferase [Planctomycetota bacterium]